MIKAGQTGKRHRMLDLSPLVAVQPVDMCRPAVTITAVATAALGDPSSGCVTIYRSCAKSSTRIRRYCFTASAVLCERTCCSTSVLYDLNLTVCVAAAADQGEMQVWLLR